MIINVKHIKENDDGSAICEIDMDDDAKRWLIERGFIAVLTEALKKNPEWWTEEDEKRMDIIGQNGPSGIGYE
jgi:hypothetical protein